MNISAPEVDASAGHGPGADAAPLLTVRDLVTSFHTDSGIVDAVRGVSFDVRAGEALAIVGESGSGKSVTAMSLLNMVREPGRVQSGEVLLEGRDLLRLPEEEMRLVRGGDIGFVFQDPVSSLNPVMRVRDQLVEGIRAHRDVTEAEAERRAAELMERVGIPDPEARLADYPLAFSGGMSQRVMIAIALANDPKLIIADEPTTALDVTIQAQILDLLAELNREHGTAVVLITHNLGIVARLCSRVAVMYAGKIVEEGRTIDIFERPRHAYTRDLLGATPRLDHPADKRLVAIEGRPPAPQERANGCPYALRDPLAIDSCFSEAPPLVRDANGHRHACWLTADGDPLPPRPESTRPVGEPDRGGPTGDALLRVTDLTKAFPAGPRSLFGRRRRTLRAVDEVSFTVARGETVGLVGESGCGKSTVAKLVLGIEAPTAGRIEYDGSPASGLRGARRREYNRHVQLIFQNPMSSLNPRMPVGDAIAEPLRIMGSSRDEAAGRVAELLDLVGMSADVGSRYPHEFSGGQRQRLVIARALAVDPQLVVCDEAVAALDVSLQAQVINLLGELQRDLGLSYLFIGHDLATVRYISDRILVMYLGEIVESGPADAVVASPQHPYTASLLSSVPEPDPMLERERERISLAGEVPTPLDPPPACRFHTRCPIGPAFREDRGICATDKPPLRLTSSGHEVACHFAGELADTSPVAGNVPTGLGPVRRSRGAA